MTLDFFRAQMARMNGLRFAPADLQTHWEGLRELPDDVLEAAVGRAIKMRIEFPTPVELRQDADQVKPASVSVLDQTVPLDAPREIPIESEAFGVHARIRVEREWRFYCEACGDSGMREFWCGPITAAHRPWLDVRTCDIPSCRKLGEGYAHAWVRPCECIDTNPALIRKREQQATYAAERAK